MMPCDQQSQMDGSTHGLSLTNQSLPSYLEGKSWLRARTRHPPSLRASLRTHSRGTRIKEMEIARFDVPMGFAESKRTTIRWRQVHVQVHLNREGIAHPPPSLS